MGAILRVGDNSSFKMLTNRLIDTRVELLTGTHIVEVAEIQKDNNLTLAVKDATVVITKRGLYRFDVDQSRIKVFEGVLGVTVNGQSTLVGSGKAINTTTASVEKFDKEATDAMDHWARRRAELIAMANASSAKQVHDYGCSANSNFAAINGVGNSPCNNPCNSWRYNPWYGLVTYIPCGANIYSPYGYRYWSPYNVMRAFYVPPPSPSIMAAAVAVGNGRLRRNGADIERIFGRHVGAQQFGVLLDRGGFIRHQQLFGSEQRFQRPRRVRWWRRPQVDRVTPLTVMACFHLETGHNCLIDQLIDLACGAERAITAGSADSNQFGNLSEQIGEVFRVDGEIVAARRRPAFARWLVRSHLRSRRMIVLHPRISQHIARHSCVAEDQRISAFVQFGKSLGRRRGNVHRIASGLQDRL